MAAQSAQVVASDMLTPLLVLESLKVLFRLGGELVDILETAFSPEFNLSLTTDGLDLG